MNSALNWEGDPGATVTPGLELRKLERTAPVQRNVLDGLPLNDTRDGIVVVIDLRRGGFDSNHFARGAHLHRHVHSGRAAGQHLSRPYRGAEALHFRLNFVFTGQ